MQTPKELTEMIAEQWPGCPRMIFETLIAARDNEILGEVIQKIEEQLRFNANRDMDMTFKAGYEASLLYLETRLLAKC